MPPLLICHRLPLLLLLLVAVADTHGDSSGDTYDPSMCLFEPYTCGGINFSYPFYLASEITDLNGYQNFSCGYPGLGIVCDDERPILQLGGENYTVKSIDGARATLADPEVLDNSCPRVDHNVSFELGSWLDIPASTVDYLDFFFACNFTPGLNHPPTIGPITCTEFGGGGLSFVIRDDSLPPGNWSQACEPVIKVPVLKYDLTGIDPNSTAWRTTGYGEVLRQGFNVSWDNNKPGQCTQCEESSNGRCAFRQTGEFLGCLCTNGQINDENCGTDNSTGDAALYASRDKNFIE